MKSKKIIVCFTLAVLLVLGIVFWKVSSNDNLNEESEISETTTDSVNNSNKDSNTEDSSATSESKVDASNSDKTTDQSNNSNTQEVTTNSKLSGKDAVISILKHFVDEDEVKSQHIIPVALNGQVAKAEDNDNTFFCDSKELNDSTKTGLIIILESYDESNNSYKYNLKDYHAIVNGKDDSMGTGTVSGDGSVTED